jgi:hypothetical protein
MDASGGYSGGFFYGQNLRPANPEQCHELNAELENLIQTNINYLYYNDTTLPYFVQLVNVKYSLLLEDDEVMKINLTAL